MPSRISRVRAGRPVARGKCCPRRAAPVRNARLHRLRRGQEAQDSRISRLLVRLEDELRAEPLEVAQFFGSGPLVLWIFTRRGAASRGSSRLVMNSLSFIRSGASMAEWASNDASISPGALTTLAAALHRRSCRRRRTRLAPIDAVVTAASNAEVHRSPISIGLPRDRPAAKVDGHGRKPARPGPACFRQLDLSKRPP